MVVLLVVLFLTHGSLQWLGSWSGSNSCSSSCQHNKNTKGETSEVFHFLSRSFAEMMQFDEPIFVQVVGKTKHQRPKQVLGISWSFCWAKLLEGISNTWVNKEASSGICSSGVPLCLVNHWTPQQSVYRGFVVVWCCVFFSRNDSINTIVYGKWSKTLHLLGCPRKLVKG